jgi:hypothetical protein
MNRSSSVARLGLVRLAVLATAAAAALALAPGAIAHADPPADDSGEEGQTHLQYPATAAVFRAYVSERITTARAKLEHHIVEHQINQQRADVLRARFNAAIGTLNAKVDAVCADGTVTHEEAHEVHELAKQLRHHPQQE